MVLRVSTLATLEDLRALEPEWLSLLSRAGTDLPFLFPEWAISWWEVFRQERPFIRDRLHVKAIRTESGELVGLVPLMVTERPGVGPARLRTIGFLGADRYVTEQRAPVVDPRFERGVAEALAADLARDLSWSWIAWEGLQPESDLVKALGQGMELRWTSVQAGNILQLPLSWDLFRASLKRNIKQSLRHCYNSLKRDGLTAQLEVATTQEEITAALEIFFDLHARRAQYTPDGARADRFAHPGAHRFLRLASSRFAARDVARVFTLRIGGVPVASRVGFQLPECLYLYYSGFDPEWGKYGVATTLLAEAIKYAIDARLPRLHLSMGADTSKSRWSPEMPLFHAAFAVRPDLGSRAALRLYAWTHAQRGVLDRVKGMLGRRFD